MKLGQLVLRYRDITSIFANRVGGAAEYAFAREHTLKDEMAFILPIQESSSPNEMDAGLQQKIVEQFGVVVAIKNDTDFKDKTGFAAYNRLHDVRTDVFKAFLGYDSYLIMGSNSISCSESNIYYRGGQLLDFDRAYLWYQFSFEYSITVESMAEYDEPDGYLDKIFAQYEMFPSSNLPVVEDLPVDLFSPDMEQMVDIKAEREDRNSSSYSKAFSLGFDILID